MTTRPTLYVPRRTRCTRSRPPLVRLPAPTCTTTLYRCPRLRRISSWHASRSHDVHRVDAGRIPGKNLPHARTKINQDCRPSSLVLAQRALAERSKMATRPGRTRFLVAPRALDSANVVPVVVVDCRLRANSPDTLNHSSQRRIRLLVLRRSLLLRSFFDTEHEKSARQLAHKTVRPNYQRDSGRERVKGVVWQSPKTCALTAPDPVQGRA